MEDSPHPNEVSPEYLAEYTGTRLIVANTIMLVITTSLLGLRFYARSLTNASRGWDDLVLPPSWIFLVGLVIIIYVSIPLGGVGRHVEAVVAQDPRKVVTYPKLIYLLDWFYVPSNALSRISVVVLYLRVFTNKPARFFCWVVFAFLVGNAVSAIIAANLECIPLAYTWDKTIQGRCFNQLLWYKITNFPNVIADIAILFLPVHTIRTLKASKVRKAGIALVCLTGSVGLIASCIRTSIFFRLADKFDSDPTWEGTPTLTWTIVECGMYFSAACLIGLRPLLSRGLKWFRRHVSKIGSFERTNETVGTMPYWKVPLRYVKPGTSARTDSNDADSLSHIVPMNCDVGVGSLKDDPRGDVSSSVNPTGTRQIRVDTKIEVNSAEETL